jgi:pilus assembly protein CpaE
VAAVGMRATMLSGDALSQPARPGARVPDLALVDVRQDRHVLALVPQLKRRYPSVGVAVVAPSLDPALMLEAMRAGVNEVLAEPVTLEAVRAAIDRLVAPAMPQGPVGLMVAIVGAKGGVGATTIAVNLAEALARGAGDALLIDLHVTSGDAGVLLGVEPRFTVLEALENTHRLDAAFLRGLLTRTASRLELLGSSSRVVQGTIDPQRVRTLLSFASSFSKNVVLDVPRQDYGLLESLESAGTILVVVNQELPTVRNAVPLVQRLQQRYGDRVGVVVNRADRDSEITLDDVKKAVRVPLRHVLPNDYRHAMTAANKGQPLASGRDNRLAESFYTLAAALSGAEMPEAPSDERAPADSSRLFGWLSPRRT